jgi:hypothetical protein
MTRREHFIKHRAWLKTDHFAVTKTLRSLLEASGMPDEEQQRLAYIQNKVLTAAAEGKWAGKWASIPRSYWSDRCRGQYKRYIDTLVAWEQLNVRKHPAYCTDAYPKHFQVPPSTMADGTCTMNFARKRFRPPTPDNNPTDEASRYALKCLSQLSVVGDDEFWLPEDPLRRSRVKEHCEHIAFQDYRLAYGTDSKRLFHRVIMMPAEGRRNLRHSCRSLVEYDLKSCHPVLLLTLMDHDGERKQYQNLLSCDIYTEIGKAMGVEDRERVKVDFLRVVNAGLKKVEWLNGEYVFQYFSEHFPHFAGSVLSKRTDLALFLQNLEAELMVQQLGSCCIKDNLFGSPSMTDGLPLWRMLIWFPGMLAKLSQRRCPFLPFFHQSHGIRAVRLRIPYFNNVYCLLSFICVA